MLEKALEAIKRFELIKKGDRICVAVSGGADSVSLLHVLFCLRAELGIELSAVHINHMIRGAEADSDTEFVKAFCASLNVALECCYVNIPQESKLRNIGLEECGRLCRYEIFTQITARTGAKIATAHTLSDSVETMLLNITRGCAVSGLAGIPPKRGDIIRPLILCTREDVEAYCKENSLVFVTDSTNLDTAYSRNLIRHKVIPELQKLNPSLSNAALRLSRSAGRDDAFLNALAREELKKAKRGNGYNIKELAALDEALLFRTIALACVENGTTPESVHIELAANYIKSGSGAVALPGRLRLRVDGSTLHFDKCGGEEDAIEDYRIEALIGSVSLPDGRSLHLRILTTDEFVKSCANECALFAELINNREKRKILFKNCADYDIIKDNIFVRNRNEGDRFSPAGRGLSKSLKELFREAGVPANERMKLLMLEACGEIIFVEGIGVSDRVKITERTKHILKISIYDTGEGN